MTKSKYFTIVCTFSIILFHSAAEVKASTLDQSFEPDFTGTSAPINSLVNWAQTFTVGLTGTLTQVDLLLHRLGLTIPPGSDIIMEIRPTASGIPNEDISSVLASALIPPGDIPAGGPESFVAVDISTTGLSVTTGDVLAIVLRAPGIDVIGLDIDWWGNSLDEYGSGSAFRQFISGGSFTWDLIPDGDVDFGFRTYVQVIPIPPALWLFGSGLLALMGIARRKKAS
jgi:hypothetical protein